MEMNVTNKQLMEVIRLAKNYRESDDADTRSIQEIMDGMAAGSFRANPDYTALCDYLVGLGYPVVLDIEALMDYGGELISHANEPESLKVCYDYMQSQYGGDKGDLDLAVEYIAGKLNLADRLEMAMNDAEVADNGHIRF